MKPAPAGAWCEDPALPERDAHFFPAYANGSGTLYITAICGLRMPRRRRQTAALFQCVECLRELGR